MRDLRRSKEIEIERIGKFKIFEIGAHSLFQFTDATAGESTSAADQLRALAELLAPHIEATPSIDVECLLLAPLDLLYELRNVIFDFSKIDRTDEEIPEGHEHVSHVENEVQSF